MTDEKPGGKRVQSAQESVVKDRGKAAQDPPAGKPEPGEARRQERHQREIKESKQAHEFRIVAFVLVCAMAPLPIALLMLLGWSAFFAGPDAPALSAARELGPWPVGAFIVGVFAAFIAVFGFLAKGAFGHPRRKDDQGEDPPADAADPARILGDEITREDPRDPPQ